MSDTDFIVEEIAREQRLKVCACHSVGSYLRDPATFDAGVLRAGYICARCQELIDEISNAKTDYERRVFDAIDAHTRLHDELASDVERDQERLWEDKLAPEPLEEPAPPPKPLSWAGERNPEIAFIDQASEEDKATLYRPEAAQKLLRKMFPYISAVEWKVILS